MVDELFTIGNYTVTGYGLCLALAVIAAYFSTEIGIRYYKLDVNVALPMVASAVIPGFIGSKTLFIIQTAKSFEEVPKILSEHLVDGYIIYGGIIAAIPSVYICLRLLKVDILQYMDVGIASIAIAQTIGRFGCFLAGCCYGHIVEDGSLFAVTFSNSRFVYDYYSYFPIQLVCVALNLVNFIFLISLKKHVSIKGVTMISYMITYGIGRFIIEFFRGDEVRGFIGPISVAQFISIFMTITGIICMYFCISKHKKEIVKHEKSKKTTKKRIVVAKKRKK